MAGARQTWKERVIGGLTGGQRHQQVRGHVQAGGVSVATHSYIQVCMRLVR